MRKLDEMLKRPRPLLFLSPALGQAGGSLLTTGVHTQERGALHAPQHARPSLETLRLLSPHLGQNETEGSLKTSVGGGATAPPPTGHTLQTAPF